MDLYELVASWIGWPIVVAILLLLGGAALWLLKNRLDYQKEINEQLRKNLEAMPKQRGGTLGKPVQYGAVIKLIHEETSLCLHSHNYNYQHPGSSKQQQITAFGGSNEDDYWKIKGPHNFLESYKMGEFVQHGDIIRLEHTTSRKNLHSHGNIPSPITGQQEVTGFGKDGIGDINDNWRVDVEGGGTWNEGTKVRLIHQQTNAALHSHRGHNLPDYGYDQQEVTCFRDRNKDDWWRVAIHRNVSINDS
ncbi:MAG: MIR domain-containing protein [Chloroflexota bacterium]